MPGDDATALAVGGDFFEDDLTAALVAASGDFHGTMEHPPLRLNLQPFLGEGRAGRPADGCLLDPGWKMADDGSAVV